MPNQPQEEKKCDCKEMSCKEDCKLNHTHKGFFCKICEPEAISKMEASSSLMPPDQTNKWQKEVYGILQHYLKESDYQPGFIKKIVARINFILDQVINYRVSQTRQEVRQEIIEEILLLNESLGGNTINPISKKKLTKELKKLQG